MRIVARLLLLGLSLTLAVPAGAVVDGPVVNWRFATFGSPRAGTVFLHEIKKYVEEETGGKFTVTIGYGSFGAPKEFLDLLRIGSIHGAIVQAGFSTDRLPLYTVLDLPFLPLGDLDVQRKVHDALHQHPTILKEFAAWNALPFMSSLLPQYEITGKGRAPKEPADLKGVRIRALGDLGRAFEKLGAAPTTVPAPDMYVALDRGLVSALSIPIYSMKVYKTYEVAKWMSSNLMVGTTGLPLSLNLEAWNALPPQYRALLATAREKAYAAQKAAIEEEQVASLEFLKQRLEQVRFSEGDLAKFHAAGGKPVWEEWVRAKEERGLPGREILDFILRAAGSEPSN